MDERLFVRPAEGLRVRDPQSKLHIPTTGRWVPRDSFWLRRLRSGDVVVTDPPTEAEE